MIGNKSAITSIAATREWNREIFTIGLLVDTYLRFGVLYTISWFHKIRVSSETMRLVYYSDVSTALFELIT